MVKAFDANIIYLQKETMQSQSRICDKVRHDREKNGKKKIKLWIL